MEIESIRLQKFLASQGIASRREAERMIEEGRVEIDGNVAVLGDKVVPGTSQVKLDGRTLQARKIERQVIAMNKPRGLLCSHEDPHHTETVFDLLSPTHRKEKWIMVGRLDKESEGLLLLTNDGDFAQQLSHPSKGMTKRYRVETDKVFNQEDIPKILRGIKWEGNHLQADKVFVRKHPRSQEKGMVEVHLHQGRKHEIRNLFYAFGYRVRRLKRFQIGQYIMKGIPNGGYRILSQKEIKLLQQIDT